MHQSVPDTYNLMHSSQAIVYRYILYCEAEDSFSAFVAAGGQTGGSGARSGMRRRMMV
jgi:hypothetical protein